MSARGRDAWDVVVIGAGPAGSVAARECARGGARVLLLDKAVFPRAKVCGCCLNASAMGMLRGVGLGELPARLGAVAVERLELACGAARATLRVRGGVAVSREALDTALIEAAVGAGVEFRSGTAAVVEEEGGGGVVVGASHRGESVRLKAGCVLVADGLTGTALVRRSEFALQERSGSRMGAAVVVDCGARDYETGAIFMTCGSGGYVGAVRLEDGRLNVAAAFDPGFVREAGGPGAAACAVLERAGMARIEELNGAKWKGTPGLTRRRTRVESGRVLVIGDSAGYVEPFTGEGMAWAVASGVAVAPIVLRRANGAYLAGEWARKHRRIVGARQRACRGVAWVLRRPRVAAAVVRVLSVVPGIAGPVLRRVEAVDLEAERGAVVGFTGWKAVARGSR